MKCPNKNFAKLAAFAKNAAKVILLCQIDSAFLRVFIEKCLSLHPQNTE